MEKEKTLREIRQDYVRGLSSLYGEAEALSLFYWTARELLKLEPFQVSLRREETCLLSEAAGFARVLERLSSGEPVQYVFSKAFFAGLELFVDSSVLIPRPETEQLWEWAVSSLKACYPGNPQGQGLRLLDACTGSGALAIALSKAFPRAEVWACDLSEEALAVAIRNNEACGASVRFFRCDVLAEARSPQGLFPDSLHLMVANPPYVRPSERSGMRLNVLGYEPALALFVPEDDPLLFYKSLALLASRLLADGGMLMEEINEAYPAENRCLLLQAGFSPVSLQKDFQGRFRMLQAFWPGKPEK